MDNRLWSDIQAQGHNLAQVVQHVFTTERKRIETAASFLRNDRPIALIGVASAEYVCMPSEIYLNQKGRYASVMCASDAYYSYLPALKHSNVVINSRSGETVEIVKLGQGLVENDIPFVAVTNEPDSTLAKMATHVVWANTRKDDLVSINVVTGMMTVTLAVAHAVAGELDENHALFADLAGSMAGIVEKATHLRADIHRLFSGSRPVHLIYRGHSKGAACCGRLVLEEVSRAPAIAMEAAEFRQGPNEVIDERFAAVLFVPRGKQGELNLSLAEDIISSGGRVMLVGNLENLVEPGAESAAERSARQLVIPINNVADALRPVLEVVPVQVLAYELARAQGFEPGEVRYISKVILSEEGIPNKG